MAASAAFPPPHSCDFCQKLVLYDRDGRWWIAALGPSPNIEGLLSTRVRNWLLEKIESASESLQYNAAFSLHRVAVFDCTLGEARLAANAGCNFCVAIVNRVALARTNHGNESEDEAFLGSQMGWCGVLRYIKKENQREKTSRIFSLDFGYGLEILALLDNPASKEISTWPINVTPSSEDSLQQVHGWLDACLKTHHTCPAPTGKFMPTRVLEIVQRPGQLRSHLRLRETSSMEPEPYAALSYCWGGPQPMTTINDSYRRHSLVIDKQALPSSVRDAVLVAEKIGIKYLWIDAFCIVQDDQGDKNWEIVQMPLIYSQATVTIAASRAKAVGDGFLHDRLRMGEETPDQVFELPYRCSDNKLGSVVLLPKIQPSTEPLDLRAWPLQERFLSPRILEYGSLQTRWICQTSDHESPIDGFNNSPVHSNERFDNLFTRALQNILGQAESTTSGDRRQNLLDQWDGILKIYTHRTLTLGTDRLPAISGIAAQFGRVLCDEYRAGLWKSDMESQLLWTHAPRYPQKDLQPRPLDYQGPSWSWAAINGPIQLTSGGIIKGDDYVDVEIVDCKIKLHVATANFSVYDPSFGAVQSASLQLRGRLGLAKCMYGEETSDGKAAGSNGVIQVSLVKRDDTGPEGKMDAQVHLDALEVEFADKIKGSMPVFLIKITGPITKGLILRHIEGSKFSRLGVFKFKDPAYEEEERKAIIQKQIEWLDNSPLETITII